MKIEIKKKRGNERKRKPRGRFLSKLNAQWLLMPYENVAAKKGAYGDDRIWKLITSQAASFMSPCSPSLPVKL
jgi:hypothetical protein